MSKNTAKLLKPPVVKVNPQVHAKQAATKGVQQVQNPVTREQVTQQVTQMIQQSGIPPKLFVKIGKLCEAALHDKKKYKDLVDFMVEKKLETRESMKKPDFQMLASMVVIGKVAETLPDVEAIGAPPGMAKKIQGL